jgi:transcription initiation factor TFIIIB Brf1 subunit/transcription initiation factor TFIIB
LTRGVYHIMRQAPTDLCPTARWTNLPLCSNNKSQIFSDSGCYGCGGPNVKLYMGRLVCDDCEAVWLIDSLPEWRSTPATAVNIPSDAVLWVATYTPQSGVHDDVHQRRPSKSIRCNRGRLWLLAIELCGRWLGWIRNPRGKIPVSVMHLAQRFYKTVNDMPGTRRAGLCEGAIYTAFKACGVTRSTREITSIFDTSWMS